jgi:hypothetical protein
MTVASCFDISLSGGAWKIPDEPSEVQPAYERSSNFAEQPILGERMGSLAAYLAQPVTVVGVKPIAEPTMQIWDWPHHGRTAAVPPDSWIAMTGMVAVEKIGGQEIGLQDYQAIIESLPLVKRTQLLRALRKINGYLLDIESSDDGEIIIETREDGLDCFYAICTREGDFKGTWISQGILKKESWSANPPYDLHALSLI